MHDSSMTNMRVMLSRVLTDAPTLMIDYGGRRIDGHDSYYSLVKDRQNVIYKGLDIVEGPGVDIVSTDPYACPVTSGTVDIIVTGQMFEHCEFFWKTAEDMFRILKPGGYLLAITPSAGAVHRYPVDCWRFYPDSYAAISRWAGFELVDSWTHPDGKWRDCCGIMRKPV